MKFVIIFGPQAVGKMTVGHELEKVVCNDFHLCMGIRFAE